MTIERVKSMLKDKIKYLHFRVDLLKRADAHIELIKDSVWEKNAAKEVLKWIEDEEKKEEIRKAQNERQRNKGVDKDAPASD